MLMQLQWAGKLENVRGIIFGEMLNCVQPGGQDFSLQEVVMRIVGELGIPVAYGLPSGHVVRDNVTLPFGVGVQFKVGKVVELNIESATNPVNVKAASGRRPAGARKRDSRGSAAGSPGKP